MKAQDPQERIAQLERALRPFAYYAAVNEHEQPADEVLLSCVVDHHIAELTRRHFTIARAVLGGDPTP